ncbi:membrane protein FAM174B [Chelonoidis abingdonii]|uniref:membrane protein FAM174B n=1 Tax=Chelonoidis abingdonii TaxID=106734 RepID=UPI003F498E09
MVPRRAEPEPGARRIARRPAAAAAGLLLLLARSPPGAGGSPRAGPPPRSAPPTPAGAPSLWAPRDPQRRPRSASCPLLRDLSALKAAVIARGVLSAGLIGCLLLRVCRSGKRIKKTRKYDIITTPAERVEMAPLNEDEDDDEDSTVFDVKYSCA